jgi:hypothetical protein
MRQKGRTRRYAGRRTEQMAEPPFAEVRGEARGLNAGPSGHALRALVAAVAAVLMVLTSVSAAQAATTEQSASTEVTAAQSWDSRCNWIQGSPLCVAWYRNHATFEGEVEVFYTKNSGPRRYIRLYVASCGSPMFQVYEGYIQPGQTRSGSWDGYVFPGSCWIGYMRIGNARWTTGPLYS